MSDSRNSSSCRKTGDCRYIYFLGDGRSHLDKGKSKKNAEDFPLADFLAAHAPAPALAPAPAPAAAPDVLGGASSLAELDALTVSVTPAPFNINV